MDVQELVTVDVLPKSNFRRFSFLKVFIFFSLQRRVLFVCSFKHFYRLIFFSLNCEVISKLIQIKEKRNRMSSSSLFSLWNRFIQNKNGMDPNTAGPLCWYVYHQLSLCTASPQAVQQFEEMTNNLTVTYYCSKCRLHFEQGLGLLPVQSILQDNEKNLLKSGCDVHNLVNRNLGKTIYSPGEIGAFMEAIEKEYIENVQFEQIQQAKQEEGHYPLPSTFEKKFVMFLFLLSANFPVSFSSSLPRHRLLRDTFPSFFKSLLDLLPEDYVMSQRVHSKKLEIDSLIQELKMIEDSVLQHKGRAYYMLWTMSLVLMICPGFIQHELKFDLDQFKLTRMSVCDQKVNFSHWERLIRWIEEDYRFHDHSHHSHHQDE